MRRKRTSVAAAVRILPCMFWNHWLARAGGGLRRREISLTVSALSPLIRLTSCPRRRLNSAGPPLLPTRH
eukprot:5702308-Prymnesium_polylepis.1